MHYQSGDPLAADFSREERHVHLVLLLPLPSV